MNLCDLLKPKDLVDTLKMIPLVWLNRFSDEEEYMDELLEYMRPEYYSDCKEQEEENKEEHYGK